MAAPTPVFTTAYQEWLVASGFSQKETLFCCEACSRNFVPPLSDIQRFIKDALPDTSRHFDSDPEYAWALMSASYVLEVERFSGQRTMEEQRSRIAAGFDAIMLGVRYYRFFVPLDGETRVRWVEVHPRDIWEDFIPSQSTDDILHLTCEDHQPPVGCLIVRVTKKGNPKRGVNIGSARPLNGSWLRTDVQEAIVRAI